MIELFARYVLMIFYNCTLESVVRKNIKYFLVGRGWFKPEATRRVYKIHVLNNIKFVQGFAKSHITYNAWYLLIGTRMINFFIFSSTYTTTILRIINVTKNEISG